MYHHIHPPNVEELWPYIPTARTRGGALIGKFYLSRPSGLYT